MARYLMDTNVLLRAIHQAAPEHPAVVAAMSVLTARGDEIYLTPQVLVEFWAVMTRPARCLRTVAAACHN